jgi:hypothetical protein
MDSLTKEQLIEALTVYYTENKETPDVFAQYSDNPAEDAIGAAEYIFEISAQHS